MVGIYKIKNLLNDKVYIGSSTDINRRHINHLSLLNRNKHHAFKLQLAWNKYGSKNFVFELIEEVFIPSTYNEKITKDYLESLESYYISLYNSYYKGYNSLIEGTKGSGYFKRKKKVYQFSLDGKFIQEWESLKICSQILKIPRSTLLGNLTHRRHKANNFIFSYTKTDSVIPYTVIIEQNKRIY